MLFPSHVQFLALPKLYYVLHPYNKAETDGLIGAMLLAKALKKALKVKPVIVCPQEAYKAVEKNASKQLLSMLPPELLPSYEPLFKKKNEAGIEK